MKLIIHAGLHKTATTSFQRMCAGARDALLDLGVFYPPFGKASQHSIIPLRAQAGSYDELAGFIAAARAAEGVHTILVSAEDLENVLIDLDMARRISAESKALGVAEVSWVFVLRDPFDYFESLYAELSKHAVITRYDIMARAILDKGYFSADNGRFVWNFAFDHPTLLARFRNGIADAAIDLSYADLTAGLLGEPLFALCGLNAAQCGELAARIDATDAAKAVNKRVDPTTAELGYVCRTLGLAPTAEFYRANKATLDAMIRRRTEAISAQRAQVKEKFRARFGGVGEVSA